MLLDHLRVYYQTVYHVQAQIQDTVDGKETFGNGQSLICRVIQSSLEPLGSGSDRGIQCIHHHITGQRRNTLTSHGITLICHCGGTDLILLKRLFHFLQVL